MRKEKFVEDRTIWKVIKSTVETIEKAFVSLNISYSIQH